MKKIFLLLLAMFTCVVSVYAQSFGVDGISYKVTKEPIGESPGEVEVTRGEIKEEITIPKTVSYDDVTYIVVSIGNDAFRGRGYDSKLRKCIIPGTVRTIGTSAFYDNYYLEEVEFNEGLETIGQSAFGYAFQLKEIRIPSTVTSIAADAFITNEQNRATISCLSSTPPNVESSSFQGRTDVTLHVVLSDIEVYKETEYWKDFSTIIGDILFRYRCDAPKISLDNNLLTMSCETNGSTIYYTTDGTVPNDNAIRYASPVSYSTNQIIRAIAILEGYENSVVSNFYDKEQMEVIIDEQGLLYTLKQADDGSFCYWVTGHSTEMNAEIIIPDNLNGYSVKAIDGFSFDGCSSLLSITIPHTITSIGDAAFQNCSNLTSINIPGSVKSIGGYAFSNCKNLTFVNIPGSMTTIGENAFQLCWSLKDVKVTITDYSEFCNNHILEAFDYLENCQLIDINGNEIVDFIIPEGVSTLVKSAFRKCRGLSSITIPNSVTNISDRAFDGCSSLSVITIPNNVTNIGERAFDGCSSLSVITIPNSVTSIGEYNQEIKGETNVEIIPVIA